MRRSTGRAQGDDRQPHRPARGGLADARRSSSCARSGPTGSCARSAALEAAPGGAGAGRQRSSCRTSSCRRITTSAPSDVVARRLHGALAAAAERGAGRFRRAAARRPASAPAPCARSRWWRRSCTARPAASAIRPASRSPMAARTAIPSRCRLRVYDETIRVLKIRRREGEARTRGGARRAAAPRRRGAPARARRPRAVARRVHRRGAPALAGLWRPHGLRPGATDRRGDGRVFRCRRKETAASGLSFTPTRPSPSARRCAGVLSAFSKKRRMLRAAWRMRCSFSTRAMRT